MQDEVRLLYVINDPEFFLSHRLPIARAAKENGMEVHVAAPQEMSSGRIAAEGFVSHAIRLSKHGTGILGEGRAFLDICRLFRELKPSVVHLVTIKPVLYGGIAARLTRIPSLVSAVSGMGLLFVSTDGWVKVLRLLAQLAYCIAFRHRNQVVIFQNPDDREYCVANKLVDMEKAVLIKGSGVDIHQFAPTEPLQRVPVVLLAGRMLWEKGVGDFVEAARLLRGRGIAARFVLVGQSVAWNSTSVSDGQLKSWHEEGVVEWWGRQENMPEVFSQADIACLPSKYGEGVPKFLIEAAACGKPIITTDSPGCREIVRHEVNGILVSAGDILLLATAIERLLLDSDLRIQMGQLGRELAIKEFRQELVISQTLEVYDRILSSVMER